MREGEKKPIPPKMKNFFRKRWVFPAMYLLSAALLISGIIWYQMSGSDSGDVTSGENAANEQFNEPAAEVNSSVENVKMPLKKSDEAIVKSSFYDVNASEKQQETALVVYNNTYHPNTGIDFAAKNGKSFDVTAALSGTVTKVQEDSLLGNVIEIEHSNGVVTNYQSVTDIQVAVGDKVIQGDEIAKAGQSLFNEKAGIHVHFEIRKDQLAVNPQDYFNKSAASIQEVAEEDKTAAPDEESKESSKQESDNSKEESKDENSSS